MAIFIQAKSALNLKNMEINWYGISMFTLYIVISFIITYIVDQFLSLSKDKLPGGIMLESLIGGIISVPIVLFIENIIRYNILK